MVERGSRVVFALAVGCIAAGAVEFLRTLRALGNLQFAPTTEIAVSFSAWTSSMLWSSLTVIASGVLLAMAKPRTAGAVMAIADAVVMTVILTARVRENVGGYLIPADAATFVEHPLPIERWPMIYRHPWPIIATIAVLTLAACVYAGWRNRPSFFALIGGPLAVLLVVVAGGSIGFVAVAFLRLRNWSIVTAIADAVVAAMVVRSRRDLAVLLALAAVIAGTVAQIVAWSAMKGLIPTGSGFPAW